MKEEISIESSVSGITITRVRIMCWMLKEFIVFNIGFFFHSFRGVNKWYGKSGQLPLLTKNFRVDIASARNCVCVSVGASVCLCLCSVHTIEDIVNFICAIPFATQMKIESKPMHVDSSWRNTAVDVMFFNSFFSSFVCVWIKSKFRFFQWLQIENRKRKYNMTCVCNAHCAWETHWMNEWTLWHHTWLFGCGYARVRKFCAKWCQVKSQCLPQKKMWQVIHFAEVCMAIISFRSKSIPFLAKRVFSCCFIPMKTKLGMKQRQ